MIFIVTIQDKTLYGEPDVAIAVVEASDEQAALHAARPTIIELAERGRCRCVPHAREIEPGKFYRLGALVRLPQDPNAETSSDEKAKKKKRKREETPPSCPRCGKTEDAVPATNYGHPTGGWQYRCCGISTWPKDPP